MKRIAALVIIVFLLAGCRSGAGNTAPTVDLVASPSSGEAPLTVEYSIQVSDADGDPLTYRWDLGDGNPREGVSSFSRTYSQAGTYSATVTVTDGRGGEVSDTATVTVTGSTSETPYEATNVYEGRWLWTVSNYGSSGYRDAGWMDIDSFTETSSGVEAEGVWYRCDFDGAIYCSATKNSAVIRFENGELRAALRGYDAATLGFRDSDDRIERFSNTKVISGSTTITGFYGFEDVTVTLRNNGTSSPIP